MIVNGWTIEVTRKPRNGMWSVDAWAHRVITRLLDESTDARAEVERLRADNALLSELLREAKPYVTTHNGLRIRIWAALSSPTEEGEDR